MGIAKILSLEDRLPALKVRSLEQYVLRSILEEDVKDRAAPHVYTRDTGTLTVPAVVNGGRWIVRCPTPHCVGGQFAHRKDRRFWCTECHNARIGHRWAIVAWPDDAEVAAIERALLARHAPATRNWTPRESVADLVRENLEHPQEVTV